MLRKNRNVGGEVYLDCLEIWMTLIVQRLNERIMLGLVVWYNEGHQLFE